MTEMNRNTVPEGIEIADEGMEKIVGGITYYTVKRGDNLSRIARRYGVSIGQLMAWNPIITDPDFIRAGWVLRVA